MKLKRWLAVTMSALLIMYSFPVYATGVENEERMQTELSVEMEESVEGISEVVTADEETVALEVTDSLDECSDTELETAVDNSTEETVIRKAQTEEMQEEAEDEKQIVHETVRADSDTNIAGGSYENITWVIDANGKLTVTGTGEFATLSPESEDAYWTRAPWYESRESILSAEVNVTGMHDASCMFRNCSNLKSVDVSNFDTSQILGMEQMFYNCSSLERLDLSGFQTSNVILMDGMFWGCTSMKSVDVSSFQTSNVTWMAYMFKNCSSLESVDVSRFDTGKVGKLNSMFEGCSSLKSVDVSGFDTKSAFDMNRMFYGCSSLESVDVSGFDTSKVTLMQHMFRGCSSLKQLDVSGFQTGKVTDMLAMFRECSSLESLDVSSFDTSSVQNIDYMFACCTRLKNVDVSGFHTDDVMSINGMFRECDNITSLDLSSFNLENVKEVVGMFSLCENLRTIRTPKNIVAEIALPASIGYSWYCNGAPITLLPQNLSTSVEVTKDAAQNLDSSNLFEIITTKIENVVQNVPYEAVLQNNGWDTASYYISSGALPTGIELSPDGVIYGITKETGKFQFTVTMTVNGMTGSAEKAYTLEVLKSTDKVVDAVDEPGYEIIQPISDIDIKKEITDQLFISNGPFEEFRDAYLDGDRLIKDVDYTAESGSTRITIKSETLDKLDKGKHTLGVEFRTNEGSLKRVAQNFDVTDKSSGSSSKRNNSNDSREGLTWNTLTDMSDLILWEIPHPEQIDEYGYYPVDIAFASEKNALMPSQLLGKYYGQYVYLMEHLGNGIGYSITATDIDVELTGLDLSAVLAPLNEVADDFKAFYVHALSEITFSYRVGIHVNVGAQYSGSMAYLFIYDKSLGTYVLADTTSVSENGNVMTFIKETADMIILVKQ